MKKVLSAICIYYAIFSFLFNYVFEGINRVMLIIIGLMCFSTFLFYIRTQINKTMKDYGRKHKNKMNNLKKENMDIEKRENLRRYDEKVKPLYENGRNLFATLMKQGKIRNYEILDLKNLINDRLGIYKHYYKNYKFDNDAKEIYVKMKNFNLNEYDWDLIIEQLHTYELND